MSQTCIKCSAQLTSDNWKQYRRENWINKCDGCIRVEKRAYQANWRLRHPGASALRSLQHKARLKQSDPVKARAREAYNDCRKRAMKMGMAFDLTSAGVLAMMREAIVCPYFGLPLTHAGKADTLASIDRIDSARGYTRDNVRVISYLANLMKSHASAAQLLAFADGVQRQHGLRTVEKIKGVAAK